MISMLDAINIAALIGLGIAAIHPTIHKRYSRYKWAYRKPFVCAPCLSFWVSLPLSIMVVSPIPSIIAYFTADATS